MAKKSNFPYLHGFTDDEQNRLRRQAAFGEQTIYADVDFSDVKSVLEVGSGVGAQTEILLRRFPQIHVTGIELSDRQLQSANSSLSQQSHLKDRYELIKMDAGNMQFPSAQFDGAFLCWVLEHVPDPSRVLSEVRRVLKPGARIFVTEVMNSTFFLDPYSPNVWKYWMAFNDYQFEGAGDPFIGAKLGNLLASVGFQKIETHVKTWHFDNREPAKRQKVIEFWTDLLLSAGEQLVQANYVTTDVLEAAKQELASIKKNPNAVFFYSFMQASAVVQFG